MSARVIAVACSALALPLSLAATPAQAASPIVFAKIQYDSPGSDSRTNASLNAEYVTIKNTGSSSRSLTGWTVRDNSNHVYTFGTFTLGAGKSVVLRTGRGTNTGTTRYWGSGAYVWNNTGDKAVVRTSTGTLIDSCAWTSTGSGSTNC